MTYLGKNIKKIRTIQKLSQANFGEIFGLSRASIGAYEEGRAEAKLDVIIKIANHFSITVDNLVNKDITVNELSHFNIFDDKIGDNINIGHEILKNLAFIEIPAISSHDLVVKDITDCRKNSINSIKLPFVTDEQLAIIIDKDNFRYIAKNISTNDIIIVLQDLNFWKKTEPGNKYWLIKTEKSLYIGEIKNIKNNYVLFFPEKSDPISIPNNKMDFILPIDAHISNKPKNTFEESEKLKQLELKINDLYNRL